jgi:hypothetical protein
MTLNESAAVWKEMIISGLHSIIQKLFYNYVKALRHSICWLRFYNNTYRKRYSCTSLLGKCQYVASHRLDRF